MTSHLHLRNDAGSDEGPPIPGDHDSHLPGRLSPQGFLASVLSNLALRAPRVSGCTPRPRRHKKQNMNDEFVLNDALGMRRTPYARKLLQRAPIRGRLASVTSGRIITQNTGTRPWSSQISRISVRQSCRQHDFPQKE